MSTGVTERELSKSRSMPSYPFAMTRLTILRDERCSLAGVAHDGAHAPGTRSIGDGGKDCDTSPLRVARLDARDPELSELF